MRSRRDRTTRARHDTPPFGVGAPASRPGSAGEPGSSGYAGNPTAVPGAVPFEIRDRLIELDDLRKRGILSEEEFAAKKSELLDRI